MTQTDEHREPEPESVREYLSRVPSGDAPWNAPPGIEDVSFLARGEYSLNYLVRSGNSGYVARLVTGTQIGLPLREQAVYEFGALGLLVPSGITPRPYLVDPEPSGLPYPLILEQYLPGRPLNYSTDLAPAACCVATIHNLGVPDRTGDHLQLHPDPAPSILEESRELAAPYLEWKDASAESKAALRKGFEKIEKFLEQKGLFTGDDLAIVNYDLNTHNFVVEDGGAGGEAKLLDWEKARIAPAHPGPGPLPAPDHDPLARRYGDAPHRRSRTRVHRNLSLHLPGNRHRQVPHPARSDANHSLAARRLVVRLGVAGDRAKGATHHKRGDHEQEPRIPGTCVPGAALRRLRES